MANCLLCTKAITNELTFTQIFSWNAITASRICAKCRQTFRPLEKQKTCSGCGRQLTQEMTNPCLECKLWQQRENNSFCNHAIYEYNSAMKEYMSRYKFEGDYRLRQVFQTEMSARLRHTKKVVVPIPVTLDTMQVRGFNQVTGWFANLKYYDVLTPIAKTKTVAQSQKDRKQRLKLEQPFQIIENALPFIQGRDVLLVDDIYTTGRTIRHAANLLILNGARSVTGLTLAR